MSSPGGGPNFSPEQYSGYMEQIQAGINESSGYQREVLKEQMKSASAARENAMKIAQLQASTSRYGIDAQSATAMRELKEKARQFDADHGLEIAKTWVAYSSTPDMMFARNDFMSAMGRVGQGLNPTPYMSSTGQPHAKTWEDFSSTAQYNGSTIPGGSGGGGGGAPSGGSGGGGGGGQAANPTDPRVSAANAIMKAAPPSESPGADGQDWAALTAIRSMYETGKPGMQKLGPERMKIAQAGMARLGYDPRAAQYDYNASLPGQMSSRLA